MATELDTKTRTAVLFGYYLTVALHVLGAVFPESRLWAFNWWAYMPTYVQFLALAVALIAPFPIISLARRLESRPESDTGNTHYWWWALGAVAVMTTLFIVFRTQSHILGDGYRLIADLTQDQPIVKGREIGESWLHVWLSRQLRRAFNSSDLLTYRIISISAGAVLVGFVVYVASRLYDQLIHRLSFAIGILSGGYLLLYFGYVENYSLFILAYIATLLVGLLVLGGRFRSEWTLVPMTIAVLMHSIGLSLLPPVVVLLLIRPGFISRWNRLAKRTQVLFVAVAIVLAAGIYAVAYSISPYLQHALLSPSSSVYTIEDYTLFSGKHLVDFANELMLLIPGLLVSLAGILFRRRRGDFDGRAITFLGIASLSGVGAAFLIDPKLGMAADWDLLAFSAIALTLLLVTFLLQTKRWSILMLFMFLAIMTLGARVATLTDARAASSHFTNYLKLDPVRAYLSGAFMLRHQYLIWGDSTSALQIDREWRQRFPEWATLDTVETLFWRGQADRALQLLREVKSSNPHFAPMWSSFGIAFTQLGQLDSAIYYLDIAEQRNPYSAVNKLAIANVYLLRGDTSQTRIYLRRAWEKDSTKMKSVFRRNPPLKAIFDGPKSDRH